MDRSSVVTVFLEHQGKVLVLRRSDRVSTGRGMWAGVSGRIEPGEAPLDAALREVAEETGLRLGPEALLGQGEPFPVSFEGREFVVHPFLLASPCGDVTLNWEHVEARWVDPVVFPGPTVARLDESLRRALAAAGRR